MKRWTAKAAGLVAIGLFALLAGNPALAKKKPEAPAKPRTVTLNLTGTRPLTDISSTVASVGDVPNHEIAQRVYSYVVLTAAPDSGKPAKEAKDFDGATTMNFAQSDSRNGAGTHNGYATWKLKSGDLIYVTFNGKHSARGAGQEDAAPFDGEFEFAGGTGKYANIKGHSSYQGKVTATGSSWEAKVMFEY
ncbi:MAG: hypothetical protein ABI411_13790 [Tahibacter sp.]